jgi:hypothetical protein
MEIFDKFWEYPTLKEIYIFGTVLGSIGEEVLFGTMTMKVHIELYAFQMLLPDIERQLVKSGNFRKNKAIKIHKLPIKILAGITSPIITHDHPIGINHGDNIHHKHIPNNIILRLIPQQLPNKPLHNKRRMTLTGVNTSTYEDGFLLELEFGGGWVVGYF